MKIIELDQDTPQWHEFRKEHIGASEASIILNISPYRKPSQLWAEKLGIIAPQEFNGAMQRGKDLEEKARQTFCLQMGDHFKPLVCVCTDPEFEFMSASLDGYSEQGAILEIKCNGKKWHAMVEEGKVPPHHMAQLQHQLYVCKSEIAYYFSFDGEEGRTLEVRKDKDYLENLLSKEKIFWEKVISFDPI